MIALNHVLFKGTPTVSLVKELVHAWVVVCTSVVLDGTKTVVVVIICVVVSSVSVVGVSTVREVVDSIVSEVVNSAVVADSVLTALSDVVEVSKGIPEVVGAITPEVVGIGATAVVDPAATKPVVLPPATVTEAVIVSVPESDEVGNEPTVVRTGPAVVEPDPKLVKVVDPEQPGELIPKLSRALNWALV